MAITIFMIYISEVAFPFIDNSPSLSLRKVSAIPTNIRIIPITCI